ncbi:MAG: hypothetical protein Q9203_001935 [Teloschistes exilis]
MAAVNGAGGGMPMMNSGVNGATPRPGNEEEHENYVETLNTYIYDYFLKNHHFDCAKAMLNDHMPVATVNKHRGDDVNGNMHSDTKDDRESKIPDDLPLAAVPTDSQGACFLFEWFGLFWDVFFAHQRKTPPASADAMQYVARTQHEHRLRQEQQQNLLRVPGMMGPTSLDQMHNYQQMLYRQQNGGMPGGDLRQKALQNQNRHFGQNPQQVMAMQKQAMMQQQMRRDPSEMGVNGQRPRTPSSGDNAPSPSKRPRIEGHPGMMMMQNGRSQQMLDQNNSSPNALLMQGGIPPSNLNPEQLAAFQRGTHQVQQKSLDVYNNNLKHNQQHQNMNKPIMPGQGSPMMQAGMDLNAVGAEYFAPQMQMRAGMPNGNGASNGGNHALQDYQMQLMLLEQQNKKRLLMARQEQETPSRGPDGQPGMPGAANFVGPSGMSPSGSRSGPSPGPNEQGKRGSPKMGPGILPASPMPDGSMPQARGSPAASMTLGNNMQGDMFQMKNMNEGMAVMGANSNMMRQPPSSHPFNGQYTPQQIAEMQRRGMPNGNWQPGPQGQVPMMQQQQAMPQPQQATQMGTPQQRGNNMPPPSNPPAGAAANGRSGSPAPSAAPATPSQTNKANPKGKKDAKDRKKPTKKNSTAGTVPAATPSSEAENPPSTPITPVNPASFTGQKVETQGQPAVAQGPTTAAPAVEQLPPENGMEGYPLEGGDVSLPAPSEFANDCSGSCAETDGGGKSQGPFDMTFGNFDSGDHLQGFDFDSFLQDGLMDPEQFSFESGAEPVGGT